MKIYYTKTINKITLHNYLTAYRQLTTQSIFLIRLCIIALNRGRDINCATMFDQRLLKAILLSCIVFQQSTGIIYYLKGTQNLLTNLLS